MNRLMSQKGFTLLELTIVVIIIGVLAAIAVPQYAGFVERARTTEVVNAMGSMKIAEESVRLESGAYIACPDMLAIRANIGITASLTNWVYVITVVGGVVVITATRTAANGGTLGQTIVLAYDPTTMTSTWGGTHPNRPRS